MVTKLLKRFAEWILDDERALAEAEYAELSKYLMQTQRQVEQMRTKRDAQFSRIHEIQAWMESRNAPDNAHRFMFEYMLRGHETGGTLSATGGVHPAKRWGIKDFVGRDWSMNKHGGCML